MRSLYEISEDLRVAMAQAEAYAQEHEGELSDALVTALDAIEGDRQQKIGNICRYIKSLNAEAEMVKSEADALAARVKSAKGKAASLKAYLSSFMPGGETYKDENSRVSWRKSEGVNIVNVNEIPDDLCKIERKPIATDIKAALKCGELVTGAELYTRQNIQIK